MMVGVTVSGYDDDDDDVGVIVPGTPPVTTANIILITPLGLSIILSFIIPPTDGSTRHTALVNHNCFQWVLN